MGELSMKDLEAILEHAKAALSEGEFATLKGAVQTLAFLTRELEKKSVSVQRLLWNERRPVSAAQVEEGRLAWSLLRQSDPTPLAAAATGGLTALPFLARALRRHCQELPWAADGLGLTQRLILERLADRPHRIGEIFRDLMLERDPLPFLTDLMLADFVEAMKRVTRPVFTGAFEDDDRRWYRERLTITPLGLDVLAGATDYLSLLPPERWLGGVCIRGDQPCWRWDETRETTTRVAPAINATS